MTESHRREIDRVLQAYPGAQANGFPLAQSALWLEAGGEPDEIPRADFLPDAYLIDREAEELLLFEVEITSFLSGKKCAQLGYYWYEWDSEDGHDWLPVLITVDRHGTRARQDLCEFYHRYTLAESSSANEGLL